VARATAVSPAFRSGATRDGGGGGGLGGGGVGARSEDQLVAEEACEPTPSPVRVVVRLRPPLSVEELAEACPAFVVDSCGQGVESFDLERKFLFDLAFRPDATQEEVYENVGIPVVDDVLKGYHGTVLAYGQTGGGKTYCMFGPQDMFGLPDLQRRQASPLGRLHADSGRPLHGRAAENLGKHPKDLHGLVPRSARRLFERMGDTSAEFEVECSFLEVYCEQISDLLRTKGRKQILQVRESPSQGIYIDGLSRKPVRSTSDVVQVLRTGLRMRTAAVTRLNQHSSRSHAVFVLDVHQHSTEGVSRHGKLTFVDLAGSEKLSKSGSAGEHLEEAKKINLSLSALGHVIDALAESRPHVPYRDSQLTRILEDSLGGNCLTTLLVACSPSTLHSSETLSSLRFAARAKKVLNSARQNVTGMPDRQLLQRITRLRAKLANACQELDRRRSGGPQDPRGAPLAPARTGSRTVLCSWAEDMSDQEADKFSDEQSSSAPSRKEFFSSDDLGSSRHTLTSSNSTPQLGALTMSMLSSPTRTSYAASREDRSSSSCEHIESALRSRSPSTLNSTTASTVSLPPETLSQGSTSFSRQTSPGAGSAPFYVPHAASPRTASPRASEHGGGTPAGGDAGCSGRGGSRWAVEATALSGQEAAQAAAQSALASATSPRRLSFPEDQTVSEAKEIDRTGEVKELQWALQLERLRCATLRIDCQRHMEESQGLWRQLEDIEREVDVEKQNVATVPVIVVPAYSYVPACRTIAASSPCRRQVSVTTTISNAVERSPAERHAALSPVSHQRQVRVRSVVRTPTAKGSTSPREHYSVVSGKGSPGKAGPSAAPFLDAHRGACTSTPRAAVVSSSGTLSRASF